MTSAVAWVWLLAGCGGDEEREPLTVSELSFAPHSDDSAMFDMAWEQSVAGEVQLEFAVDDGVWIPLPPHAGEAGANEQLLVGVPYGEDAEWRIVDPADGQELEVGPTLTANDLPPGFPTIANPVANPDAWLAEGNYLLGSFSEGSRDWAGGTYWMWIVDRQGRVVWTQETPGQNWTLYATVAVTGDRILYDEQTYWNFGRDWDEGESSKIHSTYLDEPIETFDAPGLHHAFIQMPDESLVWGSVSWRSGTETLLQRSPGDTEPTELWNCLDDWPGVSYCESNSMWYDADRDAFLYSFYTTEGGYTYQKSSALVEIDRSTGNTVWWAGLIDGGLSFDPPESEFSWQHGIVYTESGTLLLSTETEAASYSPTISGREYEVDVAGGVLRQIWSYDSGYEAPTNGDIKRLANGNILHAIGSSGQILEIDASGTPVWQLDCGTSRLVGRVEFIRDLYDLVSPEAK